jgi:large subunit ribosomal protein L23
MSGNIVRFPRMLLTASRTRGVTLAANQKAFTCAPSVTKHEIKEYLTKIYGLDVRKVQTSNYDGTSGSHR